MQLQKGDNARPTSWLCVCDATCQALTAVLVCCAVLCCVACKAGFGGSLCAICPANTWSDGELQTANCTECTGNKVSLAGSDAETDCGTLRLCTPPNEPASVCSAAGAATVQFVSCMSCRFLRPMSRAQQAPLWHVRALPPSQSLYCTVIAYLSVAARPVGRWG
jgi:hypothetical protein